MPSNSLVFDRVLQYDIVFMIIFCIVGLFIKYFFASKPTSDGSSGPASATIWGYGLIGVSMLVILFISVGLVQKLSFLEACSNMDFLKSLLTRSLPPLILLVILIWVVTLNVKHIKTINKDIVPHEYNVADNILSMMIFIQILIILKYIYNLITETKMDENVRPCGVSYNNTTMMKGLQLVSVLIGVISSILLGIMNVILVFFITDG